MIKEQKGFIFEKIGFFTKMKISIFNLEEYQILATRRILSTIIYIVTLMLIYSALGVGIFIHKATLDIYNIEEIIQNFIYSFSINTFSIFFDIIALCILAFTMTMLLKIKLHFRTIFNISAYSLTLSVVLNTIYLIISQYTHFVIKEFNILYSLIAIVYICASLLIIKVDIIMLSEQYKKINLDNLNLKTKIEIKKDTIEQELKKNEEENEIKEKQNEEK